MLVLFLSRFINIGNRLCMCTQLCLTLSNSMDYSPPGSSTPQISQARILGWVAISSSWRIFRIQWWNPCLLCLLRWQVYFFTTVPPGKHPWWLSDKESTCNAGDAVLIPELGRSPGGGNDNPLQYSHLENAMDRGAWRAIVHGILRVRHYLLTKSKPP